MRNKYFSYLNKKKSLLSQNFVSILAKTRNSINLKQKSHSINNNAFQRSFCNLINPNEVCSESKDLQKGVNYNYSSVFTNTNFMLDKDPDADEIKGRQELALCHRLCEWLKLNEGVDNHLTLALPCNTKFLIGCYGIPWNRVSTTNLLLVDIEGKVVRGTGVPQLAGFTIHSNIHKTLGLKRAKVILHTHQPYTTAISCMAGEHGKILNIHQNSCRFLNSVIYDVNYRGIVESQEEGLRLANLMKVNEKLRIIMMGNHGVSTVAPSIDEAMTDLYYLEAVSRVQVLAMSAVGGDLSKLRYIRPEIVEFTHEQYRTDPYFFANKLFDGWKKTIDFSQPDYLL